ncbi:uncharacterized protein RCC_03458 [Ramularia collo-cygni]|uniref:CAP-Gly domain-containing protein n=1 Tax=Ramularia collo-cygni TaxID=112498 RepID=A0A2D3UPZ4_9PEZI|nr:uncharacterized protein RCC_03458 [Ramularia collo-cygni]CZT17621.1 uncharacterized protein RCC_03458 [Ramularia collo-cygni]
MALQTPGRRNLGSSLARPSFGTASSPSLRHSTTQDVNRKASLQALTSPQPPAPHQQQQRTPTSMMGSASNDLEVGDAVTVPGDMYGLVRFVGSVKGKAGKFVGVELDRQFAARGKNDGDVDGVHYFRTQIPGAGIFLPIHRAEKRSSRGIHDEDGAPLTPNTPGSITSGYGGGTSNFNQKFSQTVGHGAYRPTSPYLKAKRPSLPRPESPLRRPPPNPTPTPGRQFSASVRGATRPALPSTTPSKNNVNMRASVAGSRPSTAHSQTPRPYSRTGSRMGSREESGTAKTTTSSRNQSNGSVKSFSQPLRPQSRLEGANGQEDEIQRLRMELAERDKRLAEQAANLADMDASVKELSGLLPPEGIPQDGRRPSYGGDEVVGDATTAQLRQLLREKNEKITLLTTEFDAHRADFRSTLDSLEMASTETERVYEEQKRDLLAQIQAMEEQAREMGDLNGSRKEFEEVANQLKGLEEFVQELEEGLEDARRGEAEARGEVEFLRGEVERGRSELKREREKAAANAHGSGGKEMEKMEDEIKGLKAIIHSFSTTSSPPTTPTISVGGARLSKQLAESEAARAKLEIEMEQLRRDLAAPKNGTHSRNESAATTVPSRPRADTVRKSVPPPPMPSMPMPAPSTTKFCDMCESSEHDTLDCNTFQEAEESLADEHSVNGEVGAGAENAGLAIDSNFPGDRPAPLSPSPIKSRQGSAVDINGEKRKSEGKEEAGAKKEEELWCALCEKEGHFAYECPDEQY